MLENTIVDRISPLRKYSEPDITYEDSQYPPRNLPAPIRQVLDPIIEKPLIVGNDLASEVPGSKVNSLLIADRLRRTINKVISKNVVRDMLRFVRRQVRGQEALVLGQTGDWERSDTGIDIAGECTGESAVILGVEG